MKFIKLLCVICSLYASVAGAAYSQLVVFGESTSSISGSPGSPYDPQTWSDGDNWTQTFANHLGLSLSPYTTGGTNYAYGGASSALIQGQISTYLSDVGNAASGNALYVIWGGGNDMPSGNMAAAAANLASGIEDLVNAGAANFLVLNLFDAGLSPVGTAQDSTLSHSFNTALDTELEQLVVPGSLFTLDVYALINNVALSPSSYGLTNVVDQCYDGSFFGSGTNTLCTNPEEYLWWDIGHFTEAANTIIADAALSEITVVPLPAGGWLLLSAVMALAGMRHRVNSENNRSTL